MKENIIKILRDYLFLNNYKEIIYEKYKKSKKKKNCIFLKQYYKNLNFNNFLIKKNKKLYF